MPNVFLQVLTAFLAIGVSMFWRDMDEHDAPDAWGIYALSITCEMFVVVTCVTCWGK